MRRSRWYPTYWLAGLAVVGVAACQTVPITGRSQESEADHLGLIYMAKASKGSGNPPEFLSTHPSEVTRIKQIEGWFPEAMQYYRPDH